MKTQLKLNRFTPDECIHQQKKMAQKVMTATKKKAASKEEAKIPD